MDIYIYGTGSGAQKLFIDKLKKDVVIKGFFDSDSEKWGKLLPFAPSYIIKSIDELVEPYDIILISSTYAEIYEFLLEKGISNEKIFILNDYTNNEILNQNNRKRYKILKSLLKPEHLQEVAEVENIFPMGNYSSAVVDIEYVKNNESTIFKQDLPQESGIDMNFKDQIELFHQFSQRGEVLPFSDEKQDGLRFFGKNDMFHTESAHILAQMMVQFKPKRVIEAGSGFSSAVMLDTNEKILSGQTKLMFIEPYAERLKSILKPDDNIMLLEKKLQEVPLDNFRELGNGDILFIDSSHVSKTGSDVNYIIFEILPILQSGVIIHFHDVFYPFEYPLKWVYEGRGWNEDYIIRAFLQYNDKFKILFWESAIARYVELGNGNLKEDDKICWLKGGSLYIQKK